LEKVRKSKKTKEQDEEEAAASTKMDKKSDDYVLSKLFKSKKKNGGQGLVHTAMSHDMIVDNSDPDFALVEIEAEKVADEAIRALKESRKYCKSAETGMPNLAGIAFGSKSKTSVETSSKSSGNFQSSKSLLDRIKLRNQGIHCDDEEKKKKETKRSSTDLDAESKIRNSVNPVERTLDMSQMIREYLLHKSVSFNKASTEELVHFFRDKLRKEDTAKFKTVLKKMCTHFKQASGADSKNGYWMLNDEHLDI
jgi:DNA excision repair protein ERCC-6